MTIDFNYLRVWSHFTLNRRQSFECSQQLNSFLIYHKSHNPIHSRTSWLCSLFHLMRAGAKPVARLLRMKKHFTIKMKLNQRLWQAHEGAVNVSDGWKSCFICGEATAQFPTVISRSRERKRVNLLSDRWDSGAMKRKAPSRRSFSRCKVFCFINYLNKLKNYKHTKTQVC